MTDLLKVLPSFATRPFAGVLPVLEKHGLSTTDILTLHAEDLAKQTRIPLLDLRRFIAAVQASLVQDVTRETPPPPPSPPPSRIKCISTLDDALDRRLGGGVPVGYVTEIAGESGAGKTQLLLALCLAVQMRAPRGLGRMAVYVSTEEALATPRLMQMIAGLAAAAAVGDDDDDDAALTRQQQQQQKQEQKQKKTSLIGPPSLDNIFGIVTADLESQDHILEYHVPALLQRHPVGLLVLDSVAANFRAEFVDDDKNKNKPNKNVSNNNSLPPPQPQPQPPPSSSSAPFVSTAPGMASRTAQLIRLGAHLRDLARRHDIAVVVANQVADRIPPSLPLPPPSLSSSSQAAAVTSSIPVMSTPPDADADADAQDADKLDGEDVDEASSSSLLRLDHQQRWFTGWGDDDDDDDDDSGENEYSNHMRLALKTPSLGLVWSTQIACRLVLIKRPVYSVRRRRGRRLAPRRSDDDNNNDDDDIEEEENYPSSSSTLLSSSWRRWIKVVFAPHVPADGPGLVDALEFELYAGGLRSRHVSLG